MDITADKRALVDSRILRCLSAADFRGYGLGQVAYIRPALVENRPGWAVHAADGSRLAFVPKRDVAFVLARQNDLEPVPVQ